MNKPVNLKFKINNQSIDITVDPSKRLLDILREDLDLRGTKEGCSIGECGACTVIMDGKAVNACLVLASKLQNKNIQTVEGLSKDKKLSKLQESFLENGAVQCGYCTSGMLMSAKALLDKNKSPCDEDIKTAIEGNLCRCTGYIPIIKAIKASIEQ